MRMVITGASGNLGSALVRRLAARCAPDLVGMVRRPPEQKFADIEWVSVDLTEDSSVPVLHRAFADADAVVHLAWEFQPSHDPDYLEELCVGGTRRVIAEVTAASVPHLVHMSSIGAYSAKRDDEPVDESWPTRGIPTSPYSQHKAAAERLLDAHEEARHGTLVTRLRPGIVGQRTAGSALLRYGMPGVVPARALDLVSVIPLDPRLKIPMVHADDVADAIERVLVRRVGGAFNLAAEPPLTTDRIAEVFGARPMHVPARVLRVAMEGAWRARLQQVDPGWLDMAFALPLLDTARARTELGWSPTVDAVTVFSETLSGMRKAFSDGHCRAPAHVGGSAAERRRTPGAGQQPSAALSELE